MKKIYSTLIIAFLSSCAAYASQEGASFAPEVGIRVPDVFNQAGQVINNEGLVIGSYEWEEAYSSRFGALKKYFTYAVAVQKEEQRRIMECERDYQVIPESCKQAMKDRHLKELDGIVRGQCAVSNQCEKDWFTLIRYCTDTRTDDIEEQYTGARQVIENFAEVAAGYKAQATEQVFQRMLSVTAVERRKPIHYHHDYVPDVDLTVSENNQEVQRS